MKLKSNSQALKIYKKTLRLLRITNIQDKPKTKSAIKDEINWIRRRKGVVPEFKPIGKL